jgi:alpha-L-fucosidase
MTNLLKLILATVLISTCTPYAATNSNERSIKNYGKGALTKIPPETRPYLYAKEADVKWFRDAKFGIFICWGPCSLEKAEIGWHRYGPRPGRAPATGGVPVEIYDNLYKKFNPTNFNAEAWVKLVRDSGAKYIIFLTKHHDGFCLFDSKVTDYDIMSTPYGKDVCRQLADACHKYGIKLFWYYSQPDWHHPEFLSKHHEIYREYMLTQLRELLTNYGKVDGVWFDCINTKWRHWNTPLMVKMIRTLQPGILINSRWGWGMPGVSNNGDFDNPEQKIGSFKIDRAWESCATMGQGWSWRGGGGLMSPNACIRMLVQCVGSGGNLALDCGPRPDGMIDPPAVANYLAMGRWLKKNGETIYSTTGGPYKPGPYGVCTRKGKRIFLHILAQFPENKPARLQLPNLKAAIQKAHTIDGQKVTFEQNADTGCLTLDLSKVKMNDVDNIVVLELESDSLAIAPIDPASRVAVKKAIASTSYSKDVTPDALVFGGKGEFEAGIHRQKIWIAKGSPVKEQWLELELLKPAEISGLTIAEPRGRNLISKFAVEYDNNGTWQEIAQGTEIGNNYSLVFPAVKTAKVRLRIITYKSGDPGLKSFKLFTTNCGK